MRERLATGLVKLRSSAEQVAGMQIKLKEEQVVVEAKKAETDQLLVQVGQESTVADEQAAKAAVEEAEVAEIAKGVAEFQAQANADLAAAVPAIHKAEAALNGLDKNALGELKGLTSPPAAVLSVTAAVAYMLAPKGANLKKLDSAGAKKMMADVTKFLATLQDYDKDNIAPDEKLKVLEFTGTAKIADGRTVTQGFAGTEENLEFNFNFMKTARGRRAVRLGGQHLHLPRHLPRGRAQAPAARRGRGEACGGQQ